MRATIALVLTSAVSLVVAGYLFIMLLGAGSTLDQARIEANYCNERGELALRLLREEWRGRSVSDLEHLSWDLQREGTLINVNEDNIEIGGIIFWTNNETVSNVTFM